MAVPKSPKFDVKRPSESRAELHITDVPDKLLPTLKKVEYKPFEALRHLEEEGVFKPDELNKQFEEERNELKKAHETEDLPHRAFRLQEVQTGLIVLAAYHISKHPGESLYLEDLEMEITDLHANGFEEMLSLQVTGEGSNKHVVGEPGVPLEHYEDFKRRWEEDYSSMRRRHGIEEKPGSVNIDEAIVPELEGILEDSGTPKTRRLEAVEALARIGSDEAIKVIETSLVQPHTYWRGPVPYDQVMASIGKSKNNEMLDFLKAELHKHRGDTDSKQNNFRAVADAIIEIGTSEARDVLAEAVAGFITQGKTQEVFKYFPEEAVKFSAEPAVQNLVDEGKNIEVKGFLMALIDRGYGTVAEDIAGSLEPDVKINLLLSNVYKTGVNPLLYPSS